MRPSFGAVVVSLAAVLFVYTIHAAGIAHIRDAASRIGWGFAVIVLLSGAREVTRTLAWMRAVEGPAHLPFCDALSARLAGEALNTLLPMGIVVGEPAKAARVRHRLPFATAFTALMIELAFYGASVVLLFAVAVLAVLPRTALLSFAALACVSLTQAAGKIQSLCESIIAFALRHPYRAWSIVALEAIYHSLAIAEVYVTVFLISPADAGWVSAIVLETVNRAVTIIFKMLPLRIGIDEAAAALVARRIELGTTTGLVLALVRKMRLLVWSAIGLSLMLRRRAVHA